MKHEHNHSCDGTHDHEHSHGHHHHHGLSADARLTWSAVINVGLTLVQIIAGIFSGSLALIAEAIHNFSDAATLVIALAAQKIARRKPDAKRTYGYKKVETLSAYTNFFSLVLISVWLAGEAILRLLSPEQVNGWTVIAVSSVAFVVNMTTVFLTYRDSKHSQNMRAAFLHNLADSLSSIGVIIAGILILTMGWNWVDPVITLLISAYIIWHACLDMPVVVNILIDGAPANIKLDHVVTAIGQIDGVRNVHHVHVRYLNEHEYAMEAHIVPTGSVDENHVRANIKQRLKDFKIVHSTLEFEMDDCGLTSCSAS